MFRRRVPPHSIVSNELAREMAAISFQINRRVGVLVDRGGRVEGISVGGAERVEVPRKPSAPSGRMRFCTLRFISTRFDAGPVDSEELAPLALHRLDAMAIVGVTDDGQAGPVRVAHLLPAPERLKPAGASGGQARNRARPGGGRASAPTGLPRGAAVPRGPGGRANGAANGRRARKPRPDIEDISSDGERFRVFPPRPAALIEEDFLDLIRALEREFDRVRERTKVAGKAGRAVLVHVTTGRRSDADASMDELEELATSDDLDVVSRIVQRRQAYDPKTLMGSGKLQDLIIHTLQQQLDFVIVDQNLTPAQAHAIAQATDIKVIDRTQLILDIFARRARTHEGKIQVELAQLKYLLPRLMTRGDSGLSRLMGGIGGRGPGEQKLEIDRRRVRDRIRNLERMLQSERRRREQRRSRRRSRDVPVISLVGYTNAGKSTLLNLLTRSEVFVEHRMFATLDPTSRRLRLPREREVVVNDTVGFIRDLPKDLLAAFRATLEEIEDSDLVVHLVDASHPGFEAQIEAVARIMEELGYEEIPRLLVFNKVDRLSPEALVECLADRAAIAISATRKIGITEFLEAVDDALPPRARPVWHPDPAVRTPPA